MSTETKEATAPPAATPAPRAVHAIEAELARARQEYQTLRVQVDEYTIARNRASAYVDQLKKTWAANTGAGVSNAPGMADYGGGMAFNPQAYNPPAIVPPPQTELTDRYHRQHTVIAKLENELTAAKRRTVGV